MPSEEPDRMAVLQGTLDLIVLRILQDDGAAACVRDRQPSTAGFGGPAASEPGNVVSSFGAAGAAGQDQRHVGQDGEQP